MKRLELAFLVFFICCTANAQYNKGVVLETILKTDTTSIGQKIVYPDFTNEEVSVVKVILPPGKSTGWHKHVFPVFAYVLQGTLTVEVENYTHTMVHEKKRPCSIQNIFVYLFRLLSHLSHKYSF